MSHSTQCDRRYWKKIVFQGIFKVKLPNVQWHLQVKCKENAFKLISFNIFFLGGGVIKKKEVVTLISCNFIFLKDFTLQCCFEGDARLRTFQGFQRPLRTCCERQFSYIKIFLGDWRHNLGFETRMIRNDQRYDASPSVDKWRASSIYPWSSHANTYGAKAINIIFWCRKWDMFPTVFRFQTSLKKKHFNITYNTEKRCQEVI